MVFSPLKTEIMSVSQYFCAQIFRSWLYYRYHLVVFLKRCCCLLEETSTFGGILLPLRYCHVKRISATIGRVGSTPQASAVHLSRKPVSTLSLTRYSLVTGSLFLNNEKSEWSYKIEVIILFSCKTGTCKHRSCQIVFWLHLCLASVCSRQPLPLLHQSTGKDHHQNSWRSKIC